MSVSLSATLRRAGRGVSRRGFRSFVGEAIERPLRPSLAPLAGLALRRRARAANTLDDLLDIAFDFESFGITITPGQLRAEIEGLLQRLEEEPPRRMLEIGTCTGGSLFLFAQVSAPDAHVISVDLPDGDFGGGYPGWKTPLYRSFARPQQRLELLRADSHDPATLEQVRTLLAGEELDFLFIDGDHSYEGVRQDFESYSPLVREGGVIGFHDIAAPPGGGPVIDSDGSLLMVGDVPAYWRCIRDKYPSEEFAAATEGCFGIGLIRV
jgi:predicted O-methyltransferase YrrM